VALTFTPCNNSTLIEGLNLTKSTTWEADAPLIKSLIPFAKTDVPSFIEVADAMSEAKVRRNVEKIAELAKALTAGFGGGTPTEATGGQVLQTESIDTKSGNGFRYIECPSCGKDQPYAKFQVKCRSCGKAFPMDTLAKFFMEK
jgi:ribosomal protein S27E